MASAPSMFCPLCGVSLPRAVAACPGCGTDLRPLQAFVSSGTAATTTTTSPHATDAPTGFGEADTSAQMGDAPTGSIDATAWTPAMVPDVDATRFTPTPAPSPTTRTRSTIRPAATGSGTRPDQGPLEVGQSFGSRYHIIRLLGIGGMGAVYHAWDAELEVALAFKVIRPEALDDPEVAAEIERRFKRELLLARQVTHPNVVRIHDLGEFEGIKYITMPYVEGQDLSHILAATDTLPVPRVLSLAKQVASGLCAAHKAGVVHRDLKPANIMIGAEDHALIMDFGIARTASGPADAAIPAGRRATSPVRAGATRVGTIVGTIEYMAPEQARGEPIDQRADIYAFGLILYRMLVGKQLAPGATDAFTDLKARMIAEPVRLRDLNRDIPVAVEQIVSKCLQPAADARYQTTAELLGALERLDENGIPLPEPTPIWKSWKFLGAAAALIALLVAATWQFTLLTVPAIEPERDPVSILIADFVNTTGDPLFDGILEQSLVEGVEAASFVTAYDRRAAARVARQLNAGATLDENVARLVAQREGVGVVLAAGIARDGSGFKLALRSVDPVDGRQTMATEASARDKNAVLTAVARLAGEVRTSLGDTKSTGRSGETEMLSAASLEAVAEYMKGQELTRQTRDEEAIAHFRRATEIDPNFGRAYSAWGTAAFKIGRQTEADTQHSKALSLLDRMTERERYRTLGVYYLATTQNYDKAIENFETLVRLYPSDASAYNNLAVAYTHKRDLAKASEMGRKALAIYPKNRLYRSNYALYAMYAGDFKTATAEANTLRGEDPNYFMAYLPLAMASLAEGDSAAAQKLYEAMAAINARAASLATIGLADIALVEGRAADAIGLLQTGIAADMAAKSVAGASAKQIALAEAHELLGDVPAALKEARAAVSASRGEATLVPAGRVFAAARQQREADEVAKTLANQFEPQKRAYARVLDAVDYMQRDRYVDAVDSLKAAIQFADLWIARYYLGVAYETAGRHGEAISELEICLKRRGEATALFLDEVPTYRYVAPLPYWLGRAQEGLGQHAQARTNYQAFLDQKRQPGANDPIVEDARRRLASLPAS